MWIRTDVDKMRCEREQMWIRTDADEMRCRGEQMCGGEQM